MLGRSEGFRIGAVSAALASLISASVRLCAAVTDPPSPGPLVVTARQPASESEVLPGAGHSHVLQHQAGFSPVAVALRAALFKAHAWDGGLWLFCCL